MKYYVLVYQSDNSFVAIDQKSGGYPYSTDRLDIASVWPECFVDNMYKYMNMFKDIPMHIRSVDVGSANLTYIGQEEKSKNNEVL